VTCFLSPMGLRCVVETDKSAQIQSYLSKDLFQTYHFPTSANLDALAANENDQQDLEEIEFSLDLTILLDCLSLFEDAGSPSNGTWKNGNVTDSVLDTQLRGSLSIVYAKRGEALLLQ
jgi:hypothetical protein